MKIAFTDFWPSPNPFEPENNFFLYALRACSEGIEVVQPKNCDVLFYGPFGTNHRHYTNCLKIFYTGENIQPNYSECHASITFEPESYGGKNLRLPLWHLYIDWFGAESYGAPEWLVPPDLIFGQSTSPFDVGSDKRFCAIVYGKPIKSRLHAISNLSRYRAVDIFGKANLATPIKDGEFAKLETLSNYRFSLCYENSISPGYQTEKLLHGKVAGTIPIYYGHESVKTDFNPNCFIYAPSYTDDELLDCIRAIDSNPSLYTAISEEPLFSKRPNLDALCESLYGFTVSQSSSQLKCNQPLSRQAFLLGSHLRNRLNQSAYLLRRGRDNFYRKINGRSW